MTFIDKIKTKLETCTTPENKTLNKVKILLDNYKEVEDKIEDNLNLTKEEKSEEFAALIEEENTIIKEEFSIIEEKIKKTILNNEDNNIILEIRAGEGGDEASLFAFELMEMYQKTCKLLNFQFNIFNLNINETGGLKEGEFEITGKNAYAIFFNENGVHCVKRVPRTEKKGKIHTSTATVAILKQPNSVEVVINEKDLKIDTFRSSGPGGQSVNTTDSAIRITHLPTGIVVSQQDEKSQHKNKEKALKILKTRIYAKKIEEEAQKHSLSRKLAVGTAKRNERIRTYHFNQNFVKDSRISIDCHHVENFMNGSILKKFLDELMIVYILDSL